MSIFTVKDLTTGHTSSTNGINAAIDRTYVKALLLESSPDNLQVTANSTSDIWVMTGSGNDTIDLSHTTGMTFVDAGSGTNAITLGSGAASISMEATGTTPFSQPYTLDTITNFHAGDSFTFSGVTSVALFDRGPNTVYTAWNPAVPGSAVSAIFTNLHSSLGVTQSGGIITLHA